MIKKAIPYAEDINPVHNKFNYFRYYKANANYLGEIIPIFLNVGTGKNDGKYHLYDITNKIRDTAGRLNGLGRLREFRPGNGISASSISNPSENVNTFDENNLENEKKPEEAKISKADMGYLIL